MFAPSNPIQGVSMSQNSPWNHFRCQVFRHFFLLVSNACCFLQLRLFRANWRWFHVWDWIRSFDFMFSSGIICRIQLCSIGWGSRTPSRHEQSCCHRHHFDENNLTFLLNFSLGRNYIYWKSTHNLGNLTSRVDEFDGEYPCSTLFDVNYPCFDDVRRYLSMFRHYFLTTTWLKISMSSWNSSYFDA